MKWFKNKYVSMCIVTVMVITVMANPMTYLKFKLNQEYIAKVLCVNKANPQMKCNGHCYLMKQYKKAQQEEASTKKMLEDVSGFELFYAQASIHILPASFLTLAAIHATKVQFSLQEYFSDISQPPRA